MNTKMYVGNLPFSASELDVREHFSQYGDVSDVYLPMDREVRPSSRLCFRDHGLH